MITRSLVIWAAVIVCHAGAETVVSTSTTGSGAPRATATGVVADMVTDHSGGPVATSASYTLKPGYAGQLVDAVTLSVSASPTAVNEGSSTQLDASAGMDDDTSVDMDPGEIAWSVVAGPLDSISAGGMALAGPVAGDKFATAGASVMGLSGNVQITVQDSDHDNFGPVAGDGIDDAWQFGFFDEDENGILDAGELAAAAPGANPDHDLHTNFFEWASGHDPTDAGSFLRFGILSKSGAEARFRLSKTITGTTYAVERMDDLQAGALKVDVAGFTAEADAVDVELTDFTAVQPKAFYRLRLEREP